MFSTRGMSKARTLYMPFMLSPPSSKSNATSTISVTGSTNSSCLSVQQQKKDANHTRRICCVPHFFSQVTCPSRRCSGQERSIPSAARASPPNLCDKRQQRQHRRRKHDMKAISPSEKHGERTAWRIRRGYLTFRDSHYCVIR